MALRVRVKHIGTQRQWEARLRDDLPMTVQAPDVSDVQSGLEGVVAFATEIAEPDKAGGALRYRGVDIEDLVGKVHYEQIWGLLVDGMFEPGLPPAEPWPLTVRSGDPRVDVQSCLAMLAPEWGMKALIDITDEQARSDLARASVMALSFVAQSARGTGRPPVPQREVDKATSIPERFPIRGAARPTRSRQGDRRLLDLRRRARHERLHLHRARDRLNGRRRRSSAERRRRRPERPAARRRSVASTPVLDDVAQSGDAEKYVSDALDRGERLMGFGHRVYRAEDPRARVLRSTAREIGAPRLEVAEALEEAALAALQERSPDRVLATNVEFWSAVVLDYAEIPADLFTSLFTCARVAGWSAHILEQKREAG